MSWAFVWILVSSLFTWQNTHTHRHTHTDTHRFIHCVEIFRILVHFDTSSGGTNSTNDSYKSSAPWQPIFTYVSVPKRCSYRSSGKSWTAAATATASVEQQWKQLATVNSNKKYSKIFSKCFTVLNTVFLSRAVFDNYRNFDIWISEYKKTNQNLISINLFVV